MTTNTTDPNSKICPLLDFQELTIEGKDQPSYQDYLQHIEGLPDYVLKTHGVLSSNLYEGNFGEVLINHRAAFQAIKFWLECAYGVNNEYVPDRPELNNSWIMDYKLHAEEALALLHLCEEILKRDPMRWKEQFQNLTATAIWFGVIYERAETALRHTGILAPGERRSKQEACDRMSRRMRSDYETLSQREFFLDRSELDRRGIEIVYCAENAVLNHAEYIGQDDRHFWHHIFKGYKDIHNRLDRSIRNNSDFQFVGVEADGSLFVGGKGKRGKAKGDIHP